MVEVAELFLKWVNKWVRFEEGGFDALRDPRSRRPPVIQDKIGEIIQNIHEPLEPTLLLHDICQETGIKFHITYIMHKLGLTPKRPQKLYTNRASRKDVDKWRYVIWQRS